MELLQLNWISCCFRRNTPVTFQAVSEMDRKLWMEAMDGKEPVSIYHLAMSVFLSQDKMFMKTVCGLCITDVRDVMKPVVDFICNYIMASLCPQIWSHLLEADHGLNGRVALNATLTSFAWLFYAAANSGGGNQLPLVKTNMNDGSQWRASDTDLMLLYKPNLTGRIVDIFSKKIPKKLRNVLTGGGGCSAATHCF